MENLDTTSVEKFLDPYLPRRGNYLFVTATWAQAIDGRIAAGPGERTQLSGLYTKKMTHYLRTRHDAILVGHKTVTADNPKLNCRYTPNCRSPRPIILDAKLSWDFSNWRDWQVLANAHNGLSKGPWIITESEASSEAKHLIEGVCDGEIIRVSSTRDWQEVVSVLASRGIGSLMVEGGAAILDSCIQSGLVNAVVITLAPVFLGKKGVDIATSQQHRMRDVRWWTSPEIEDGVLAANCIT